MKTYQVEDKEKARRDLAKQAIALAIRSRWKEAVAINRLILKDFPRDLETYNRLGKALSELGRNREAKQAFQRALKISPNNMIAQKNLERLKRLGDEAPLVGPQSSNAPRLFIEESGKAGVTSLADLAQPKVLLKLAPGHPVRLASEGNGLKATGSSGQYLGLVEPRLAQRLARLMKGGNRYEATVTSVSERQLTIIIREVYKHPSQASTISFPVKGGDRRFYQPTTLLGYELVDEEAEQGEPAAIKDWSDDDTEPGDDDAYSPAFHRIINPGDQVGRDEEDDDL